jgi:hypothetical protein
MARETSRRDQSDEACVAGVGIAIAGRSSKTGDFGGWPRGPWSFVFAFQPFARSVVRSYHQFGTSRLIITEIPRQTKNHAVRAGVEAKPVDPSASLAA